MIEAPGLIDDASEDREDAGSGPGYEFDVESKVIGEVESRGPVVDRSLAGTLHMVVLKDDFVPSEVVVLILALVLGIGTT